MLVIATGLVSCSNDDQAQSDSIYDLRNLELDVMLPNQGVSRSGASFSFNTSDYYFGDNDSIGICVENADAGKTGYARSNVKYVSKGTGSAQTWSTPDTKIALNKDSAHVSAYHPFNRTTDPTAIAMDCTKGIDYLYAPFKAWTATQRLSYLDPYVHIIMKHAQAVLIVKYVNDGYTTGSNQLTKFETSGTAFGTKGELNSTTGATSNITGIFGHDMSKSPKTLPTANTDTMAVDTFYVLPTKVAKGTIQFKLTIDGDDVTVSTTKVLEAGKIYYFPLRYKGESRELSVEEVKIIPWNTKTVGNIQMIPSGLYTMLGI